MVFDRLGGYYAVKTVGDFSESDYLITEMHVRV